MSSVLAWTHENLREGMRAHSCVQLDEKLAAFIATVHVDGVLAHRSEHVGFRAGQRAVFRAIDRALAIRRIP